jgi:uncharacterized protein
VADVSVALASTLGAVALAGLLGGLGHCTGMCGPLVALVGTSMRRRRQADAGRAAVLLGAAAYHSARIMVYTALGAVAGAVGSLFESASGIAAFAAAVSFVLGAAVVAVGLGYLGLLPARLRERGNPLWNKLASWTLRRPGVLGAGLLGALNGLLPCGLVYGALLASAGSGSAAGGALCMLVFGVATVPALAVIQTGAATFLGPTRRAWLLRGAGIVVVLIGLQLVLRGLATLGVIPSAQAGGLMLW